MAQLGGGEGRGGHIGAMVKTEFVFLRGLRSLAMAELPGSNVGATALATARGGGERENEMEYELVGQARGVVHVMAGHARMSAARGQHGQTAGDVWRHAAVVF